MGRRKTYTDEQRLRALLQAVHAHPWARLQDAYLRAYHLDAARYLLTQWAPQLVWSMSPFTVRARDVRPVRSRRPSQAQLQPPREPGPGPYRSLRLDALACVRTGHRDYAYLAVQVDPGGLDIDWYYHPFRSAHAWGWRRQFRELVASLRFPTFVVVAANPSRLAALREAWQDAAQISNRGEAARWVRLITWAQLGQPDGQRQWVGDPYGPFPRPGAALQSFRRPSSRQDRAAGPGAATSPRS